MIAIYLFGGAMDVYSVCMRGLAQQSGLACWANCNKKTLFIFCVFGVFCDDESGVQCHGILAMRTAAKWYIDLHIGLFDEEQLLNVRVWNPGVLAALVSGVRCVFR